MASQPELAVETLTVNPEDQLPALLMLLTIGTGVVDAVSYLRLGHIFVANMTGNVVFLGFALAGAPGIDPLASCLAIAAFIAGARIGAVNAARAGMRRIRMLTLVTTTKAVLVIFAVVLASVLPIFDGAPARYLLAAILALAMGAQSAVARKLAVPDLNTTVLTMTMTALGSERTGNRRRITAIAAMLFGALAGGLLVLHVSAVAALGLAAALMLFVAAASYRLDRAAAE